MQTMNLKVAPHVYVQNLLLEKKNQKHVDVLCMFLCVGVFTET